MSELLVTRLITGEEILGDTDVTADRGHMIDITNPCRVIFEVDHQSGNARIALAPFIPYADQKTISVRKGAVAFTFKPVIDLINRYNKIFGSGLILPDQSIQMP